MEQRKRLRPAFTLVELLVVIGIIAILISILLPTISRAKDQANTTACAANLRSLGQLLENYKSEWKGSFPYSYAVINVTGTSGGSVGDGGATPADKGVFVWWSILRKYMRKGADGSNWDNFVNDKTERFMPAFSCPNAQNRDGGCDFVSNQLIMPALPYEQGRAGPSPAQSERLLSPAKSNRVKADNVLLWDAPEIGGENDRQYLIGFGVDKGSTGFNILGNGLSYRNRMYRNAGDATINDDPDLGDRFLVYPGTNRDGDGDYWQGNIRWRHRKNSTANFLMADGSVKTFSYPRLSDPNDPNSAPVSGDLYRYMLRPTKPPAWRSLW